MCVVAAPGRKPSLREAHRPGRAIRTRPRVAPMRCEYKILRFVQLHPYARQWKHARGPRMARVSQPMPPGGAGARLYYEDAMPRDACLDLLVPYDALIILFACSARPPVRAIRSQYEPEIDTFNSGRRDALAG